MRLGAPTPASHLKQQQSSRLMTAPRRTSNIGVPGGVDSLDGSQNFNRRAAEATETLSQTELRITPQIKRTWLG